MLSSRHSTSCLDATHHALATCSGFAFLEFPIKSNRVRYMVSSIGVDEAERGKGIFRGSFVV